MGFLKALGFVLIAYLALIGIMLGLFYFISVEAGMFFMIIFAYFGLPLVVPVLAVGIKRFLLTRTSYRNIRFGFSGKVLRVFFITLKGVSLTILTGGIFYPFFKYDMEKFFRSHSRYGSEYFQYSGTSGSYFVIYLRGIFLSIFTLGLFYPWFKAEKFRYDWNHTIFMNNSFQSSLTGWVYFRESILSILLVTLSLGLAYPWAVVRINKMKIESISYMGIPDWEKIESMNDPKASPLTEGLESFAENIMS